MVIPDNWERDQIAHAVQAGGLIVSDELGKRIRWTVTAEDFVLHDDWSPFKHFTVVPYFPHFRYGRTVGVVETLIDPQELLNKSTSQELHVVNTTANSGWIVKAGKLVNMSMEELEAQGGKSGVVLEVQDDVEKDIKKISPNQIPQGLDRLSTKAETYIKSVSGRGDNQMGLPRPDQSGKLTEQANKASDVTLRKSMDNLERTDFLLANAILDLVQHYYTDHRIMNITRSELSGEHEEIAINVPDQASGEVLNDLSLGTYNVVITSQSAKRTLEESEFEHALGLREAGIQIPDRFLIENSNLRKKGEIVKAMDAEAASPDSQIKRQAEVLGHQLTVSNLKAEGSRLEADALLKRSKAAKTVAETATEVQGEPDEAAKMALEKQKHDQEMVQRQQEHEQKMQHEREKHAHKMDLEKKQAQVDRRNSQVQAIATAKAAANQPKQTQGAKA
jgi:hypothetical protein